MQATKFTTMQNNHASGTQNTITQNKLEQLKSPGLVTSYRPGPEKSEPILKGKVSTEVDK